MKDEFKSRFKQDLGNSFRLSKNSDNKTLQNLIKLSMMELAYLKANSNEFNDYIKDSNKNGKELTSYVNKFLSGQNLSIQETKKYTSLLLEFSDNMKFSNREIQNSLRDMNINLIKILGQDADRETNESRMRLMFSNIDIGLESNNRKNDKIIELLRNLKLNSNNEQIEKKEGMFSSVIKNLLDLVSNLMKSPLGTILGALGLGGGGLLSRFFPKSKDDSKIKTDKNKSKKFKPKNSSVRQPFSSKVKDVVSKGKGFFKNTGGLMKGALKGVGRFALPVSLALTAYDLFNNITKEFFGDDSDKKTTMEKIRNVLVGTLSDVLSGFTFGLLDSDLIKKGLDTLIEAHLSIGKKIGETVYNITSSIYEGVKSLLPEWLAKKLPSMKKDTVSSIPLVSKGQDFSVKPSSQPITQRIFSPETNTAIGDTMVKAVNNPKQFLKESAAGWRNWWNGGSITGGVDGNPVQATNLGQKLGNIASTQSVVAGNSKQGYKTFASVQDNSLNNGRTVFGSCYKAAGEAVAKVDPTIRPQVMSMGLGSSAYQFNAYAKTPQGMSKVDLVQPNPQAKNFGLISGDIAVYDRFYNGKSQHGHIEIVNETPDGGLSAFSDYSDPTAQGLKKYLPKGVVKIYRLKGASKKLGGVPIENKNSKDITPKFNMQGTSRFKETAIKAIEKNEGSVNPTKLTKDNVGYTFGKSQFNSSTNSAAWKQIGFSDSEISSINSGKFDKNVVQQKLIANADKITQLDNKNNEELYNWSDQFAKKYNLDISNPVVKANLMDIGNQYDKSDIGQETANKLIKFSGSNKITPEAIKQWRTQTLFAKSGYMNDQVRRFKNIQDTFSQEGMSNDTLSFGKANQIISENKVQVRASKESSKQQVASNPVVVNTSSNPDIPSNAGKANRNIGDDNPFIINLGIFS